MLSRRIRHWFRLLVAAYLGACPAWAAPIDRIGATKGNAIGREQLGEDAELSRATGLYDSGQYAACVDAFTHLLDRDQPRRLRSPAKIETASTYHGACLIGVGRTTDAERVFREAILENPQMKAPDGLLFPEAVVELFLRVHESMLDEIRRAEQKRMQDAESRANREQQLREQERHRVEQLVSIAESETVVEVHNRWVASLPFGVGQFQNGDRGLGWLLLLTETAMVGTLAGSLYAESYYLAATSKTFEQRNAGVHAAILLQTISGYTLLGACLVGITEAHLAFVPEVHRERKRDLPSHLKLQKTSPTSPQPRLSMAPWFGQGVLGGSVVGSF